MRFLYFSILILFSSVAYGDKSPVFIEDKFEKFDVHWTIALLINRSGKTYTTYLTSKDFSIDGRAHSKFSNIVTKRSCNFEKSISPNVLSGNNGYQVVGKLSCDFNGVKIFFNPILCEFKTKDKKEMEDYSSERIKINNEDLYFIYGCNIVNKK